MRHHNDGQTDLHLGAQARSRASNLDPAVVHLHQTARQRQSDTQAAARPFETRLGLLEHVEDAGKGVRSNSYPRVAYSHHRFTGLLVRVNEMRPPRGVNFTALLRMFAKICTRRVASPLTWMGGDGTLTSNVCSAAVARGMMDSKPSPSAA